MKVFFTVVKAGDCERYVQYLAGNNKEEILEIYGGNGEFETLKDVSNEVFSTNDLDRIESTLRENRFNEAQISCVLRMIEKFIMENEEE